RGCQVKLMESNKSYTVCECDHLTNFAALMDISHREGQSFEKSVLTFTCSGLTCIFILLAAYASVKWNKESYTQYDYKFKVKSNKISLNQNIYFWLFVSHIFIMAGMDRTENKIICTIASFSLLFCLLTTFSFMLMLAVHLY